MSALAIFLLKLFASSALLKLFYMALFRGKASFRASRIFLLCIPLASLLLSVVTISVGTGRHIPSISQIVRIESSPTAYYVPTQVAPVGQEPYVGHAASSKSAFTIESVALAIWFAGVLAIVVMTARQTLTLRRIRRTAERCSVCDGVRIFSSPRVGGAFSVGRNIYVNPDTPKDKLDIIMRHESEHIARRHYVDLAIMEAFTLLFWFNPLMWVVRRELRSVHEFEADRGALQSGVPMRDYMVAILEETAGSIPMLATGLQSSIIKKRFLKMKTENKIKARALRGLLIVPFAVTLIAFFTFKSVFAAGPPSMEQLLQEQRPPIDTEIREGKQFGQDFSHPFTVDEFVVDDYARYGLKIAPDGKTLLGLDGYPIGEVEVNNFKKFDAKILDTPHMTIFGSMPRRRADSKNPMDIISIERNEKETRITRLARIYSNHYFLFQGPGTCLIDQKTGDRYMIRGLEAGGLEVGRMGFVRGYMGRATTVTMIFPPLTDGVKVVDFFEPEGYGMVPLDWSSGETRYENIRIDDYTTKPVQGRVIR